MQPLNEKKNKVYISGPVGALEAVIEMPLVEPVDYVRVAIVFHPHPQEGGTMDNKVVTTVSKAYQEKGFWTVRFNYRGVGKSEGEYGGFAGEIEDALSVFNWVKSQFQNASISLAGFSFGGCIAMSVAARKSQEIESLITIAPAIYLMEERDKAAILNFACPWFVVQGWADDVVLPDTVLNYINTLSQKPELWCLPSVSHFFHGKLIELRQGLVDYLSRIRSF